MSTIITTHATTGDLDIICGLFEDAIAFIRENHYIGWKNYDKHYLEEDIRKGLLFKMTRESTIVGAFSVCFTDELIWRHMEKGDAIYLHRIVLNRAFAGEKIFATVFDWAKDQAIQLNLKHIRMDTWADNDRIIGYYKTYGFRFIENYTTPDTEELPIQHRALTVALLEFSML